jgi:GNAT superfamily N-acetyltransferase
MRLHGPSVSCAEEDGLIVADSMRLLLRPLSTGDRAGLAALFARSTSEPRYRRFLSPKRELTPRELTYFTDIDHLHHEAFAAVDRRDGSIVGVGRYVHEADRAGVATVAVKVADELQGMGIGTALASHVVRRARPTPYPERGHARLIESSPHRATPRGARVVRAAARTAARGPSCCLPRRGCVRCTPGCSEAELSRLARRQRGNAPRTPSHRSCGSTLA